MEALKSLQNLLIDQTLPTVTVQQEKSERISEYETLKRIFYGKPESQQTKQNGIEETEGIRWLKRLSNPSSKVWKIEEIHRYRQLSDVKEIIFYIAEENYSQRIPSQKDLIREFGDNWFRKKFCALKGHVAGSVTIPEIVSYVGLDVLGYTTHGFHLPDDLSWLRVYLKQYSRSCDNGKTWNHRLKNPRARIYDCHWIANVEINNSRCSDPLALHLYNPERRQLDIPPTVRQI